MYKEILKLLKCPKCNKELSLNVEKIENSEIIDGKLSCNSDHDWIIREGVINFASMEQKTVNNWTEFYDQYDYDELDKKILEGIPQNIKTITDNAKKFIINSINDKDNEFILDIATGRGILFAEMLKHLKVESQIICTDLSFVVLKYDRLKAKKINPEIKVNYIACDATNLPFNDNTIDTTVSLFGIENMLELATYGIAEAKRVLKSGGVLLNTCTIIKENSRGFEMLKEICSANNIIGAEKNFLKTEIENGHIEANFKSTDIITIGESIGEKCNSDLIPFEGEWFGIVVAKCIK
jgi:ubiquinone/menaquinone biosynthesis C-methylase UbiE/uncharacterized protein YbaR (Trm112 family)